MIMHTGSSFSRHLQIVAAIFILFSISACQSTVVSRTRTPLAIATTTPASPSPTPALVSSPYLRPIAAFSTPNSSGAYTARFVPYISPDGTRMIATTIDPSFGSSTTLWSMTPPITKIATMPNYWDTVHWLSDSSLAILQNGEDASETVTRNGTVDTLPNTFPYQTFLQPSPDSKYVASDAGDLGNWSIVIIPVNQDTLQTQNTLTIASGFVLGWLGNETIVFLNLQYHIIEENLAQRAQVDVGTISPNSAPFATGNTSPDGTVLVSVPLKSPNLYWITSTGIHQTPFYNLLNWISNHTMLVSGSSIVSVDGSTGIDMPTKIQPPPSQGALYPTSVHWLLVSDRAANTLSLEDINTGQMQLIGTFSSNYTLSNAVDSAQYLFYDNEIYKIVLQG